MKGRKKYTMEPELVLYGIKEIEIPEITVQYSTDKKPMQGEIVTSDDVAEFVRTVLPELTIELQEHFVILYLSRNNKIKGYYHHSKGGVSGTIADPKIILSTALKTLSSSIILVHNHPSGNTKPSEADRALTTKIKYAAALLDITVLDHVILTKDSYYSFADEGIMGLDKVDKDNKIEKNKVKMGKQVESIKEEIKFIKRFVNLQNKTKTPESILAFIKALQRAIVQKLIRKTSPYKKEIEEIQNALINGFNRMKGPTKVSMGEGDFERFRKIAEGEFVYPSIQFIKRFIGFQGKIIDPQKKINFLKQLKNAVKSNKILKDDPYAEKIKEIYDSLKAFGPNEKIQISSSELNGLKGIVNECSCKECVGEIYNTNGKTVRRCKSSKYSDAGKGACSYNQGLSLGKIYDTKGKPVRKCRSSKYSDAKKGACAYNGGLALGKIYDTKGKPLRPCKTRKYSDATKGACAYNGGLAGLMTAEQIANLKFDLLPFTGAWENLVGKPEKNFTMMIHGEPGAGKSTFLIKFAKYLTQFGKVLYISSEEYGSVTLKNLVTAYLNPFPANLSFVPTIDSINVSEYDFVIFDSINDSGLKLEDFKRLKSENTRTAFILVCQHTKDGQFKGGKEWEHEVQIVGEISEGKIYTYKNRYGAKGEMNFFDK